MFEIIGYIIGAVLLAFGAVIVFLFGWIPILGCMLSIFLGASDREICGHAGKSLIMYGSVGLLLYIPYAIQKNRHSHELSPFWRLIALFYVHKELENVEEHRFDATKFRGGVGIPVTTGGKKMMTTVYNKTAAAMEIRRAKMDENTTAYLEARRKRAEEAEKLHRAQSRVSALKKWELEYKRRKQ